MSSTPKSGTGHASRGGGPVEIPEVWIRFFVGILGLGLAFVAALFSTVSRESGNVWATVILSGIALLLATLVGLTTVPYLARRVMLERVRNAIDYDVTRPGIVYVLITLVIGIAALNTGNNLLYIIVASLIAAILASGVISAFMLRFLELDVRIPERVFAGRPIMGRILVRNLSRWCPSFSVRVVATKRNRKNHWVWEPYLFAWPLRRPPERQWFQLPDRRLRRVADPIAPGIMEKAVYFPFIGRVSEASIEMEMTFAKRGRYEEKSFGLSTRFPFAFLTKTRRLPIARELIVYPPVEPTDEFLHVLPLITGEFESFIRGRGNDLYRIRDAMPDDSARHVDWKATAKSGSLKVREFAREDERKLRIVFDNPAPQTIAEEDYERAVATAASLAWHFSNNDTELTFLAPRYDADFDMHHFLRYLALIEPQTGPSIVDTLQLTDVYNVVITARPRGSIPTPLWNSSYFVFFGNS
ncbi:MAG TPA: DUF58 domain-containing protein [Terriglobales bacterium]|nr:DUF58 domain-containing protein [Terriglobales bacterium]